MLIKTISYMKQIVLFKDQFDKKLEKVLSQRITPVSQLFGEKYLANLLEHSRVILMGGGKRFRPFLANLSYQSFGGKNKKEIQSMGVAIELLHLFCLIHDDIIDEGKLRHGHYTLHEHAIRQIRRTQVTLSETKKAEAQGMLVGDLIFSFAIAEAERISYKKAYGTLAMGAFYEMINHVLAGEMLDVHMAGKSGTKIDEMDRRNKLKTADYSFVGPIKIGARMATASKKYDAFSEAFGGSLGIAYQIQDDALDIEGNSGKSLLTDIAQGQQTHLTFFMRHLADKKYQAKWQNLTKDIKSLNFQEVKDLYHTSGAVEFAKRESNKYFDLARHILQKGPATVRTSGEWRDLVDFIQNRKK